MNNEVTIVRENNVKIIAQTAPQIFEDNKRRCERCVEFGNNLLSNINGTITDDVDQQLAAYLEKARRTRNLMNDQRAPITKLFDQIRTEFTSLENAIDVTKKDSIPYTIQQIRNQYAARKREEDERRRREELVKAQKQQALANFEQQVTDSYNNQFNDFLTQSINDLAQLNSTLTLENFDEVSAKISSYPTQFPSPKFNGFRKPTLASALIAPDVNGIIDRVVATLMPQFVEKYQQQVSDYKLSIMDALDSKHAELEKIAKANAEEQERLKAELAAKEAAEAARLEEERKRKAAEEEAARKVQAEAQQMGDLFTAAAVAAPAYQPKTQVKKHVVALNPEGILNIISFWWSKEGQFLSLDELTKTLKKQFACVDKFANDKTNPELIRSTNVCYDEGVKAK